MILWILAASLSLSNLFVADLKTLKAMHKPGATKKNLIKNTLWNHVWYRNLLLFVRQGHHWTKKILSSKIVPLKNSKTLTAIKKITRRMALEVNYLNFKCGNRQKTEQIRL